jgi:cytochrome c peroxidase
LNLRPALIRCFAIAALCSACSNTGARASGAGPSTANRVPAGLDPDVLKKLQALSPDELPQAPADPTNKYLADPRAAEFGKKLFFETRFSGQLLDEANNGDPGTLGLQGETGKVACASCHVPPTVFSDTRSSRGQISLASGWTHRRAMSLLDVNQVELLNWDGRHDAAFNQPFTPIEDPIEFNSSRLFVAQQLARLYRSDYEAIFGPMPSLSQYAAVDASDAGCNVLPTDQVHGSCVKTGYDDPDVTRVVVNMGKAIEAYTRQLSCGQSRFDSWMHGDATALSADEQAGAQLFVGKAACSTCHSGPFLTDHYFHNIGLHPDFTFFVTPIYDAGASDGLPAMLADPLNSKGKYSDGYDGRIDSLPKTFTSLTGAFATPSLRCVNQRPSFTHTGQFRSLEDVVIFFNNGGDTSGYPGVSENAPRNLTDDERAQLVAFLRALDGPGPDADIIAPPDLAPDAGP